MFGGNEGYNNIQSGYSSYGVVSPNEINYGPTEHTDNSPYRAEGLNEKKDHNLEDTPNRTKQLQDAMLRVAPGLALAQKLGLSKAFANAWAQREKEIQDDKKYNGLSDESKKIQSFYEVLEQFGYKNVIELNNSKAAEIGRDLILYLKMIGTRKNAGAELAYFMDTCSGKIAELENGNFFDWKRVDSNPDEPQLGNSRSPFLHNNGDDNYYT